jgi:hypothetical protein
MQGEDLSAGAVRKVEETGVCALGFYLLHIYVLHIFLL